MALYRLHFSWKGKEVSLKASSLDMTHPYFVSIKGLIFPENSPLIINPAADELKNEFRESDHLMIPFQTVSLIEELKEQDVKPSKVSRFPVMDSPQKKKD
ncbi:MAG: DUF1820 family protein [Spirochaetales bacterium]|nr:DUF1820 family protein [Spirochaetales bacterium]